MESVFDGRLLRILYLPLVGLDFATFSQELDVIERAHCETRGRSMLESGAAMVLAHGFGEGGVRHDSNGRPRFLNSRLDLSLSHKDFGAAAAVVPNDYKVGVDLEQPSAIHDPEKFAQYAMAENERAAIADFQKLWTASEVQVIATLWALKESLFKATGRVLNPAHISFATDGRSLSEFVLIGEERHQIFESYVHCTTAKIITALALRM